LHRWLATDDGNVAMLFAVLALPVIGVVAAAIDYGRAGKVRGTLQVAASAAAQAASTRLEQGRGAVDKTARAMLKANLPEDMRSLPYELKIADDKSSVEIVMATVVPTTLMSILGKSEITVEAAGFARKPRPAAVPPPSTDLAGQDPASAGEGVGRLLGSPGGALPSGLPMASGRIDPAEAQAAVQQIAEEVQRLQRQLAVRGGGTAAPDPADVERLLREMRRHMR
jgi:hypothetical protein